MSVKFSQNMVAAFNERKPFAQVRFYDTYHAWVKIRVQQELGARFDPADLTNDIFITMFKKEWEFQTVKNIENYVRRTIITECRDYLEKLQQTPVIKMDEAKRHYQNIEERAVYLSEIRSNVRAIHKKAMDLLSPQCREVFILYYVRDVRIKEIATLLNISTRTVDRHIDIARVQLRREFKNDQDGMNMMRMMFPLLWIHLTS